MAIKPRSNRYSLVTTADHADILDFGPAATNSSVGTFEMQFTPSTDFAGSFVLLQRMTGAAAQAAAVPFLPTPYRRVNIAGLASDYAMVSDVIVPAGIIQVPSNALSVGLLVTCTAGTCGITTFDLQGSSAV